MELGLRCSENKLHTCINVYLCVCVYICICIYKLNLEGIQYDIIDTSSFMLNACSMKLLVSIMSY